MLLENFDDIVFVLGEDFGEIIGSFDEIVNFRVGYVIVVIEIEMFGVVNVGVEIELVRSFMSDIDGVISKYFDGEIERFGFVDGVGGIVMRGVRVGYDIENFLGVFIMFVGNIEGMEIMGSEFGNFVFVVDINFFGNGVVFFNGF